MFLILQGCGSSEMKPVDIFPEDNCSDCRMAISNESFAAEIIDDGNEVFKFDDLGCMEHFRKNSPALSIRALFVKDYESRSWIPYEKSTIVQTGVRTPMGSGKVAFMSSAKAKEFADKHPAAELTAGKEGCCVKEGQ